MQRQEVVMRSAGQGGATAIGAGGCAPAVIPPLTTALSLPMLFDGVPVSPHMPQQMDLPSPVPEGGDSAEVVVLPLGSVSTTSSAQPSEFRKAQPRETLHDARAGGVVGTLQRAQAMYERLRGLPEAIRNGGLPIRTMAEACTYAVRGVVQRASVSSSDVKRLRAVFSIEDQIRFDALLEDVRQTLKERRRAAYAQVRLGRLEGWAERVGAGAADRLDIHASHALVLRGDPQRMGKRDDFLYGVFLKHLTLDELARHDRAYERVTGVRARSRGKSRLPEAAVEDVERLARGQRAGGVPVSWEEFRTVFLRGNAAVIRPTDENMFAEKRRGLSPELRFRLDAAVRFCTPFAPLDPARLQVVPAERKARAHRVSDEDVLRLSEWLLDCLFGEGGMPGQGDAIGNYIVDVLEGTLLELPALALQRMQETFERGSRTWAVPCLLRYLREHRVFLLAEAIEKFQRRKRAGQSGR